MMHHLNYSRTVAVDGVWKRGMNDIEKQQLGRRLVCVFTEHKET